MKKDTKTLVITTIAVLAFIVCVAGATYAYFQAQRGSGSTVNINANTATTDSIKFEPGKTLSITANQDTFGEGDGNASDDTMVSAKVIANNTTNSATFHYYVYLDIQKNELEYTTEEQIAELLLQVTDPDDNVVTSIPGLNYVTVGDVSGFDITEETDLITIASNYEIKAEAAAPTAEKTDEWEVKLVLVNLDTDQNANTGKQLTAKVLIQLDELTTTSPREISFSYTDKNGTTTQFTGLEGMTWREWVASSYNPDANAYKIEKRDYEYWGGIEAGTEVIKAPGSSDYTLITIASDYTPVDPDETIIEGKEYTSRTHGSIY